MFKVFREDQPLSCVLFWPDAANIDFYRARGWVLLIDEREVRRADLDDVRREDESRGRSG